MDLCKAPQVTDLVQLQSVGDSHGRDLAQSAIIRLDQTAHLIDKERDWTRTVALSPTTNLTVTHQYDGRPEGVKGRHAGTHILLSRGTWDLMKYSTPLRSYYGAVRGLVRSAASSTSSPAAAASNGTAASTSSVTFKLVHHFAPPSAELGFFAECTNATVVAAYRRVAACAVAAHNREAAASGGRMQRASVLDAWDATAAMPRSAFADDGHHLVNGALHRVADAYLSRVVCPALLPPLADHHHASNDDRQRRASVAATSTNSSSSSADGDPPEVWMSSDEAAIAARFACERVEELVRDDAGPEALEHELGLGPRRGCRCMVEKERVNDRCAFGRLVAAARSGSRKYADPSSAAGVLAMYTRGLFAASKNDSVAALAWRTDSLILRRAVPTFVVNDSVDKADVKRAGEVLSAAVVEMCLRPDVAVPCLANLGISVSPDATHPTAYAAVTTVPSDLCRCTASNTSGSCASLDQRADQLRRDWGVVRAFGKAVPRRQPRSDVVMMSASSSCGKEMSRRMIKATPRLAADFVPLSATDLSAASTVRNSAFVAFLDIACSPAWKRLTMRSQPARAKAAVALLDRFRAEIETGINSARSAKARHSKIAALEYIKYAFVFASTADPSC